MKRKMLLIIVLICSLLLIGCTYSSQEEVPYQEEYLDNSAVLDESDSFVMQPEDCFEGELYDPQEKVCYFECETDEECDRIEQEIAAKAESIAQVGLPQEQQQKEQDEGSEELTTLATYQISNHNIVTKNTKHQEIWQETKRLLPIDTLPYLKEFIIATDGPGNTLAAVEVVPTDVTKWQLIIDEKDAVITGNTESKKEFSYTLIHEFGHLITANSGQMNMYAVDISDEEFSQKQAACQTYFAGDGCAKEQSYINIFYQQFWQGDLLTQWQALQEIEDEEEFQTQTDTFYQKYQQHFVSDYAITSVDEDIAESWTHFVLKDAPLGNTIADKKVNFFYEYPELVSLRKTIRSRLR